MKQVLLTCDTETGELARDMDGAFDIFVLGKLQGREVGARSIARMTASYGARMNFLMDVYHPRWQKETAELCCQLLADGDSVGLHTHPTMRYGKRFMAEYSADEQDRILFDGLTFFERDVHHTCCYHRAGGYGANEDTLRMLRKNGIHLDSSFFYKNPQCPMHAPTVNAPFVQEDVTEIPVTALELHSDWHGFLPRRWYAKLDFKYGTTVPVILQAIDQMPDGSIIVLFLHSFNFLHMVYDLHLHRYVEIGIDEVRLAAYPELLQGLSSRAEVVFRTFEELELPDPLPADFVPTVTMPMHLAEKVVGKVRHTLFPQHIKVE